MLSTIEMLVRYDHQGFSHRQGGIRTFDAGIKSLTCRHHILHDAQWRASNKWSSLFLVLRQNFDAASSLLKPWFSHSFCRHCKARCVPTVYFTPWGTLGFTCISCLSYLTLDVWWGERRSQSASVKDNTCEPIPKKRCRVVALLTLNYQLGQCGRFQVSQERLPGLTSSSFQQIDHANLDTDGIRDDAAVAPVLR